MWLHQGSSWKRWTLPNCGLQLSYVLLRRIREKIVLLFPIFKMSIHHLMKWMRDHLHILLPQHVSHIFHQIKCTILNGASRDSLLFFNVVNTANAEGNFKNFPIIILLDSPCPQLGKDTQHFFLGSELHSWLLFFSLHIMRYILPPAHYKIFSYLVASTHVLTGAKISTEDLWFGRDLAHWIL